jgi:hypothetical protein
MLKNFAFLYHVMMKKISFAYKLCVMIRFSVLTRMLVMGIGALAVCIGVPAVSGEASRGETAITCTNPASGATWQIRINYDQSTVDSNPARITDSKISWHDAADGGNYTLDRKSGSLTVIVASSTGGFFLYDRCRLEN